MYITVKQIAEYFSCSTRFIYTVLSLLPDEEVAECRINITLGKSVRKYRYDKEKIIKMFEQFFKSTEEMRIKS